MAWRSEEDSRHGRKPKVAGLGAACQPFESWTDTVSPEQFLSDSAAKGKRPDSRRDPSTPVGVTDRAAGTETRRAVFCGMWRQDEFGSKGKDADSRRDPFDSPGAPGSLRVTRGGPGVVPARRAGMPAALSHFFCSAGAATGGQGLSPAAVGRRCGARGASPRATKACTRAGRGFCSLRRGGGRVGGPGGAWGDWIMGGRGEQGKSMRKPASRPCSGRPEVLEGRNPEREGNAESRTRNEDRKTERIRGETRSTLPARRGRSG